jgi:hypothetical protein
MRPRIVPRESALAVPRPRGRLRRSPARLDDARGAARQVYQPEAVAADGVHVRIDDRDRRGRRDHRL